MYLSAVVCIYLLTPVGDFCLFPDLATDNREETSRPHQYESDRPAPTGTRRLREAGKLSVERCFLFILVFFAFISTSCLYIGIFHFHFNFFILIF